ncbi:MAG: bifunctional folylpolyglutamate synthase/ dihydrofolate synthase [Desulfovibrio sp.]|jgi:dihydrofolate synthase/folylpolyglutamate synthase|nr:bifunctional folylpolyglutamate synthase/ dihydrofolate synthase [Desulfovibrio sp.]
MQKTLKNFQDVLTHLDTLGIFHMDLRLDRMRRALTALNLSRPPFVIAQILGTNGKGSTAAFLASLCAAHGCKVGLYTSPHFVSPAERVAVDGRAWPEKRWAAVADAVLQAAGDTTWFEFMTLLAVAAFAREQVDIAVLEAGLGGRHDATTALPADVLCFTAIALDHTNVLGPTLRHIASDKAAAVRGIAPVCTVAQFPVAADCIAAAAAAYSAPLIQADPLLDDLALGLKGTHQKANAGLALAAWRCLAPLMGKDANEARSQAQGLAQVCLPGRLHRVPANSRHPAMILDGAHNPHGMRALTAALREEGIRPSCAIFSCLADKDWRPAALLLKRFLGTSPIFIPTLRTERAAPAADVAAVCNATAPHIATALDSIESALAAANGYIGTQPEKQPILLTGSLYLLADFFTLYPEYTGVRPCKSLSPTHPKMFGKH